MGGRNFWRLRGPACTRWSKKCAICITETALGGASLPCMCSEPEHHVHAPLWKAWRWSTLEPLILRHFGAMSLMYQLPFQVLSIFQDAKQPVGKCPQPKHHGQKAKELVCHVSCRWVISCHPTDAEDPAVGSWLRRLRAPQ